MFDIKIWILDFIVEASSLFLQRWFLKASNSFMADNEVGVEGVSSLNICLLNLFASELIDGVEISWVVESFIINDEIVVEDKVLGF